MERQFRNLSLTSEEKEHLLHIYKTRLRLFCTAYIPVLLFAFYLCFQIDHPEYFRGRRMSQKGNVHMWTKRENGSGIVSRAQMYLINIVFLETPLIVCGNLVMRKRILPFKADAKNGTKILVPYEIIRKSHFPQTGQYFISFSDPNYMHHEVDETFYYNCNEGDVAYLSRAPKSKYVFDRNGRFSLM